MMNKYSDDELTEMVSERVAAFALTGSIVCVLLFFQGAYNLFETFRHLIMDGYSAHVESHFYHSWPLLLFVPFYKYWVQNYWVMIALWQVHLSGKDQIH